MTHRTVRFAEGQGQAEIAVSRRTITHRASPKRRWAAGSLRLPIALPVRTRTMESILAAGVSLFHRHDGLALHVGLDDLELIQ